MPRRSPVEAVGEATATPEEVQTLRSAALAVAKHVPGASRAFLDDVQIAVTEAVTNAVVHAYLNGPPGRVRLHAAVEADTLLVVVSDSGRGLVPRTDSPGLGRGMPLIIALAETVGFTSSDAGTEVRMSFVTGTGSV